MDNGLLVSLDGSACSAFGSCTRHLQGPRQQAGQPRQQRRRPGWELHNLEAVGCPGGRDGHGDAVRREARPGHTTASPRQPRGLTPGPVFTAQPRGAAVPSGELLLRAGSGEAPPSIVQRRADDGLDGQPLPDARAAHLAARVALHGDGRRRDYCAPEG